MVRKILLLQNFWTNWTCFNPDSGKVTNPVGGGLERISADVGTQFTSTEFKEECQIRGVCLTLAAPEHQEMNGQVEVTWRTLRTIAHSLMVHARVPKKLYTFRFNIHDISYLSGTTYKRYYKRGWRSNNTIQISNRYETFSVTFTCFILSVFCTENYGAR